MDQDRAETKKPTQPNCTGCNHPLSFHRSGKCRVMACSCIEWNGPHITTRKEREAQEMAEQMFAKMMADQQR